MLKRKVKYTWATISFEKMAKEFDPANCDYAFRQKWTHMQGQILTRGRMKWNWEKALGRAKKNEKNDSEG